jgi:hypothetical protein
MLRLNIPSVQILRHSVGYTWMNAIVPVTVGIVYLARKANEAMRTGLESRNFSLFRYLASQRARYVAKNTI